MKPLNMLGRSILLGVLVGIIVPASASDLLAAEPAGIVAIAPGIEALGPGWTERRVVFAIDPLDQPPETVNEAAGQDASNRSRLLAHVRAGMQPHGAIGTGYFGYGFGNLTYGQGRDDLTLSRYRDEKSLEERWSEYAKQADNRIGPGMGESAFWLLRKGSDHGFRLVFRNGLYVARLECTANQKPELLIHLAKIVANAMDKTTEPADPPDSASPSR